MKRFKFKRFKFVWVLGPIAILLLLPISNGHANIMEPGGWAQGGWVWQASWQIRMI